jgi:hypothetical protein
MERSIRARVAEWGLESDDDDERVLRLDEERDNEKKEKEKEKGGIGFEQRRQCQCELSNSRCAGTLAVIPMGSVSTPPSSHDMSLAVHITSNPD